MKNKNLINPIYGNKKEEGRNKIINYLIILSPIAVPLILYLVKGITTEVIHKCWVPCFSKVSISLQNVLYEFQLRRLLPSV